MTDPTGDTPDLLSQATAAQPMTHAPRSSRHRRRRRRSGPSTPLIVGVVVVVVVLAAAAVIIFTHKNSTPSATKPGDTLVTTWTYHDLSGHGVTVQQSASVKFVAVQDGEPVPVFVHAIDASVAKGDCSGIKYLYTIASSFKNVTPGASTADKAAASAFAAYAHDQGRQLHCTWVKKST